MTLEAILQGIGAYVDQDDSTPTGTDLSVRTKYVNKSLKSRWAAAYNWDVLTRTYSIFVSQASTVSIGLPTNFEKLSSPLYDYNSTTPTEYPEISMSDRYRYLSSDEFCYVSGSQIEGFALNVPKGLASGASIVFDYRIFPSSLATLPDTAPLDDPYFLVQDGIAQVLESRGDPRFQEAKADADRLLANMIENQNAKSGGMENRIPNYYEKRSGKFRIGRA